MFKTWRGAHHHRHGGGGYIRSVTWSSCMWYSLPPVPHPTVGRRLNVIAPPPLPFQPTLQTPIHDTNNGLWIVIRGIHNWRTYSVASHRWFHIMVIWTIDSKTKILQIFRDTWKSPPSDVFLLSGLCIRVVINLSTSVPKHHVTNLRRTASGYLV
jgi:hypothetical protein